MRPEAVVIHIMVGTLSGTDSWFAKKESGVSAHYGVGRNGQVHQYVKEEDQAFHAGRVKGATWKLLKRNSTGKTINPNLYTIGIEHEGRGPEPWTEEMYAASAALIREITDRWAIPLDRLHIIGHSEIYGVKTCPGTGVDLDRLIALTKA